jgi:hypothetical protein
MAPGIRKKKESCFTKVTSAIGMVFLVTLGAPVVLVGGIVQLGGAALSYGFRAAGFAGGDDGSSNGRKHTFTPMRKGVRIHPM